MKLKDFILIAILTFTILGTTTHFVVNKIKAEIIQSEKITPQKG
jgi:hypothetical protein